MQRGKELTLKLSQVANWRELRPMKLSLRETPHLVLEPTNRCNLHCRICYNLYRDYTKTLDEVKADVDLGLRKRNLETVSILGGEPTLHPELPEIVAHVRQRNLYCEMLTNGLVFLDDPADVLLDRLVRAGINRIVVHADPGQSHVHADPAAVCAALFDKLERKRVWFGISVTIYPENQGSIAALMKRYARFRFFDGILATLTRDVDRVTGPDSAGTDRLTLETEYYALSRELGVEPVSYLPTSLDDQDISWLIYFYYINARTGQAVSLSPRLNRLLRRAYRRLTGRQLFGMAPNPRWFAPTFLGSLAAEFLLRPGSLGSRPDAAARDAQPVPGAGAVPRRCP
jgi:hypothetical protein